MSTADELHSMVFDIVRELEAAASGSLYWDGDDFIVIDDIDEWKEEKYKEKVEEFRKEHPEEGWKEEYYKDEIEEFRKENPDGEFDPEAEGLETYDEWMEGEIGTADDIDEPDEASLNDYIEKRGLGDTRFEVDSSKELLGGKTLFTYGGPNIWVHDDEVCGYWGSERVEMSLDSKARDALFGWFEEMWDAIK